MIIEYDRSPNISAEQRLHSLSESIQRALEEVESNINSVTIKFNDSKEVANLKSESSLQELMGQISKNDKAVRTFVMMTDEEYDELMNLLGGGSRLIDWIYPIGHVLATVNPDYDPNKIFKTHTWVRFAKGQTLVGVNESDSDFSAAGKSGGAKTHTLTTTQIPAHTHGSAGSHDHRFYIVPEFTGGTTKQGYSYYQGNPKKGEWKWNSGCEPSGSHTHSSVGGSGSHNNLQPYTTVFYWKRTA